MRFTLLAVAAGIGIGLLARGRARRTTAPPLRLWALLVGGLALQIASANLDHDRVVPVLLAGYVLLLGFAALNVRTVGMWLVATGIALNLAAIAVNDGMPVRPGALVAAGLAEPGRVDELRLAAKHHLERPSDRAPALGDIIPVAPLGEVVSFGDVVLAMGTANVVARLLAPRPRPGAHAARRRAAGDRATTR